MDSMGAEGIPPAVINANQDAVLVVIECIIQHGIKIGKGSTDISGQDYTHPIASAAGGVMVLDKLELVVGYQFVRSAHANIMNLRLPQSQRFYLLSVKAKKYLISFSWQVLIDLLPP
jgi:hypothetical protein